MNTAEFTRLDGGLFKAEGVFKPEAILAQAESILREKLFKGEPMESPKSAARFLQMSLANEDNEHFAALFLNAKHIVVAYEKLFQGTVNQASVYPRALVQRAMEHNAAAVIFAHNHPSGDCEPSRADKRITKDLVDALALINVTVLDHFVVSRENWVSLASQGWL